MQKVNTFTRAAFLGSKTLHQKCVIAALLKVRDSRHFKTKQVEKQCETPRNSEKYQETVQCETVTDRDTYGFQLLSQTLDIYLHHPSQSSPQGFLPQLGNLYTSIARTARTFLHLWVHQLPSQCY